MNDMKKEILPLNQILMQSLCWIILLIFSIVYYKERVCYGDASVIITDLLKQEKCVFVHHRYLMILTYFLPLLFIKLGLSLKSILIVFSMNQIISIFLIASLTIYITREIKDGWLFLLAQVFWVQKSFFLFSVECISLMLPVAYFLISRYCFNTGKEKKFYLYMCVIVSLILISSPIVLLLFFMVNLLLFFMFYEKNWKQIILVLLFTFIAYLIVKSMMPYNAYENVKFNLLMNNLKNWQHLDESAMAYYFRMYYRENIVYWIIGTIIIGTLFARKKWILLLGAITVVISAHYIICIYNYQWETGSYMEMYYQLVGISICIVLFYTFTEHYSMQLNNMIFFIVFLFFANIIKDRDSEYVQRIQYLNTIMATMKAKKISKGFLLYKDIQWNLMMFDWSVAFETALLSTLEGETMTFMACEKVDRESIGTEFYAKDYNYKDQNEILSTKYFYLRRERYQLIPMK